MKKQGKRSKKKHLSKEAFRKIRHKGQDYVVYKEALEQNRTELFILTVK